MARIKFFIFFSFILLPVLASADDSIKDFQEYIEKYDVADIIDTIPTDNPLNFWIAIRENNKDFQKAFEAAKKGKAKSAQREIGEAVAKMHSSNDLIPHEEGLDFFADSLLSFTNINSLHRECRLAFTKDLNENAYSYPGGEIYISLGMYNRLKGDFNLLMAVYAHEITHFVLQHAFVNAYMEGKRLKRNTIVAGVVSVLNGAIAGVADGLNASNGIYTNNTAIAMYNNENLMEAAKTDAVCYSFSYGKKQEIEADIIAYRYLEWIGIGGDAYIQMLKLIDSDLEIFQNSGESHPLTSERIALLQYMTSDEWKKWKEEKNKEVEAKGKYRTDPNRFEGIL